MHGESIQRALGELLGANAWRDTMPALACLQDATDFLAEAHYSAPLQWGAKVIGLDADGCSRLGCRMAPSTGRSDELCVDCAVGAVVRNPGEAAASPCDAGNRAHAYNRRTPLQEESVMRRAAPFAVLLPALVGCSSLPSVQVGSPTARAQMEARSGSQVSGMVTFAQIGDKIRVTAQISGLTTGAHGFHVHEVGDCSAPDAASAKGHFDFSGAPHGPQHGPHHAGDLPNLLADAQGNARLVVDVAQFKLDVGAQGVIGRSVVIHASPDDYASQPAGNSGARVACGVIRKI